MQRYYFHEASSMLLDTQEGVFRYDVSQHAMVRVQHIREQERLVLACLLMHENTLVLRAPLLAFVWQGRVVSQSSLTTVIYRLRQLLMVIDPESRCLVTVKKLGYAFAPGKSGLLPVESLEGLLGRLRNDTHLRRPVTPIISRGDITIHHPVEYAHVRDLVKMV